MRSITFKIVLILMLCACSSQHRSDGWYPIADFPDNSVLGDAVATVTDFGDLSLITDTFFADGDTIVQIFLEGHLKADRRQHWADATERLIGRRLGFVYNDSVITAPRINARIESGAFQIISPDTILLNTIYATLKN